ncbi:MAG TPA: hypothetical protein VGG39_18880 [Polyangiaceae bacterium]|jgi:hypothetical protein
MMKSMMVLGAVVGAAVAAVACSSSSKGNGSGSCNGAPTTESADCTSCIENSCGSQVSAYESACSDYVSCFCNGGANAQAEQNCESKLSEGNCASAGDAVGTCEQSSCATQCSGTTSSSGGTTSSSGGTASSSGGTTSSSGGSGNYTCSTLSSCCSQLEPGEQSSCQQVVTDNNAQACDELQTSYEAAGLCH